MDEETLLILYGYEPNHFSGDAPASRRISAWDTYAPLIAPWDRVTMADYAEDLT